MINQVIIRGFKRFPELTFDLPGHVVLAGPNNMGKTTILQAISAWAFTLDRWKLLNDFQRHNGAYTWAPITRQQFSAVPLRSFDLLWNQRNHHRRYIEISIRDAAGWKITMEMSRNSTEQIYVRPKPDIPPETLRLRWKQSRIRAQNTGRHLGPSQGRAGRPIMPLSFLEKKRCVCCWSKMIR